MARKEIDWNLGKSRVQFLGKLVNRVRLSYGAATDDLSKSNIREYVTWVKLLYDEIRPYIADKDKTKFEFEDEEDSIDNLKKVDKKLNDYEKDLEDGNRFTSEFLERIHDFERQVQEKRIAVNLDIPKSTKLDKDSAMVEGRVS